MQTVGEIAADLLIARKTNIAQSNARFQSLGDYIMAGSPSGGMTGIFAVEDTLTAMPVMIAGALFIDALAFILTNSGGPSTRGRIGLYTADEVTFRPRSLVLQSGEFNLGAVNDVYEFTFPNRQLPDGSLWWIAFNCTVPGAELAPSIAFLDSPNSLFGWRNDGGGELVPVTGWGAAFPYGPLPINFPDGFPNGAGAYALALRVAR